MGFDLTAANILPHGADEFFRIFARFEFALKMAGYVQHPPGQLRLHLRRHGQQPY